MDITRFSVSGNNLNSYKLNEEFASCYTNDYWRYLRFFIKQLFSARKTIYRIVFGAWTAP